MSKFLKFKTFLFSKCWKKAKEFRGIRIIRYEESVYYVNVDNFKYKVLKLSKINPDEIKSRINSETKQELGKLMKLLKQTKKEKDDENKSVINIEGYDFDLVKIFSWKF